MKKRKRTMKCYFCGKEGADSKDHIPPKGIFLKEMRGKLRSNLITVPAHAACNNSFKEDDELFRNLIIAESYRTPFGKFAWDNLVVRSFRKNPNAKSALRARLGQRFIKDDLLNAYVFSDVLYSDVPVMHRQINRFNKGLFYHKFKEPLPKHISIKIMKLHPPEVSLPNWEKFFYENKINQHWVHKVPGAFSFFYGTAIEDRTKGISFLIFYDTVVWLSIIGY